MTCIETYLWRQNVSDRGMSKNGRHLVKIWLTIQDIDTKCKEIWDLLWFYGCIYFSILYNIFYDIVE